MRFCFFVPLDGFGGLEIQTILRAKDSLDFDIEPFVITKPKTRSEKFARENHLRCYSLSKKSSLFNPIYSYKLSRFLDSHSIDLCIVPKSNLLGTAVLAKKLSKRKPKIIFYQQMQSGINKKDIYHNWIYKNLDGVIVLTKAMKKMLEETTNIEPSKVFVCPYGVDWKKFEQYHNKKVEIRQKFNLPLDSFIIGCVGRIEQLKGQLDLLDAFHKANITNSDLVFVGNIDSQDYFNALREKIAEYKLSSKVHIINFTYEIPKIMNSFDLFVMPSHSETFGLVAIEAMASRLPVIATNSGGVPEIVEHGRNGLLFEPKNSVQLAEFIRKIYESKELYEKFSQNSFEIVKMKFDYRKNVNIFFEICKKILIS